MADTSRATAQAGGSPGARQRVSDIMNKQQKARAEAQRAENETAKNALYIQIIDYNGEERKDRSWHFTPAPPMETPRVVPPAASSAAASTAALSRTKSHPQAHLCREMLPIWPDKPADCRRWILVSGNLSLDALDSLCGQLSLHPLTLEDFRTTGSRTKMEDYGAYLFIRMGDWHGQRHGRAQHQMGLVLGGDWLLTVSAAPLSSYQEIDHRLAQPDAILRKSGADSLLYSILDASIDRLLEALNAVGDRIDALEDRDMLHPSDQPDDEMLIEMRKLRRQLLFMRKTLWPFREIVAEIGKSGAAHITAETEPYFRDLYDHTVQGVEAIDTYRDILTGVHDLHLSYVSNRMNEIMKVLTVISTIFMPLSFIVGLYGMNFANMPELHWRWGYYAVLGIIVLVTGGMILFFKKKRWL